MEPIKFWAETEQDTENFFNYLRANGLKENLDWTKSDAMPKPLENMGWYVYDEYGLAYSSPGERDYFNAQNYKEFFFPIPGDEFVEVSPNCVSELDGQKPSKNAPIVSDGGSTDYYKLTITNKAGQYIACEMGDVIRAVVGNDFDLGNVLKACRRMYEASQGRGKKDVSIHYDANKIAYFSKEFADWNEDF